MGVGASVCSPDSPMIDARTAQRLLDAARAHIEKDYAESYHQIYEIAVAHSDDPFDPWKGVKEIAATDQTRQCGHLGFIVGNVCVDCDTLITEVIAEDMRVAADSRRKRPREMTGEEAEIMRKALRDSVTVVSVGEGQKSKCDHEMVTTGSGTYCMKPDCDVNWP